MTTEFWVQMLVYAISLGSFGGVTLTRLGELEKKMTKHNNLVERLICVEQSTRSAHHRIDEMKGAAR